MGGRIVNLGSLWSWNNAVAATCFHHFRDFWRILSHILFPLAHPHINILWASIWGIVLWNLSISNPVYVVSIIYDLILHRSAHAHSLSSHSDWSWSELDGQPNYMYMMGFCQLPAAIFIPDMMIQAILPSSESSCFLYNLFKKLQCIVKFQGCNLLCRGQIHVLHVLLWPPWQMDGQMKIQCITLA